MHGMREYDTYHKTSFCSNCSSGKTLVECAHSSKLFRLVKQTILLLYFLSGDVCLVMFKWALTSFSTTPLLQKTISIDLKTRLTSFQWLGSVRPTRHLKMKMSCWCFIDWSLIDSGRHHHVMEETLCILRLLLAPSTTPSWKTFPGL